MSNLFQLYTIDDSNQLQNDTETTTRARRLQVGKNSFYVVGNVADFKIFKGNCKIFIPNQPNEYNGKTAVDIRGLLDLNVTPVADSKLWTLTDSTGETKTAKLGKLVLSQYKLPDVLLNIVLGFFVSRDNVSINVSSDVVESYSNDVGGSSCMTGYSSKYMRVLEDNGVRILIASKGDATARALVWKADCGETLVDRIYPNDSPLKPAIKAYADAQNWWSRVSSSLPCSPETFVDKDDNDSHRFTFKLEKSQSEFPYLDSFHWGVDNGDSFQLFLSNEATEIAFNCTEGGQGIGGVDCCDCGTTMDEDETYNCEDGEARCCDCSSYCEDCGHHVSNDDIHNVGNDYICHNCIENGDYSDCYVDGETYHIDDMSSTPDGMVADCNLDDDYTFVGDEYQRSEDCVFCEDTQELELETDATECVESGEYFSDTFNNGQDTNRGFVSTGNLDNYREVVDSDYWHHCDDTTECYESNEFYSDLAGVVETNNGWVSKEHLDDYAEVNGSFYHTDDMDENGFAFADDVQKWHPKTDLFFDNKNEVYLAQPLFAGC